MNISRLCLEDSVPVRPATSASSSTIGEMVPHEQNQQILTSCLRQTEQRGDSGAQTPQRNSQQSLKASVSDAEYLVNLLDACVEISFPICKLFALISLFSSAR